MQQEEAERITITLPPDMLTSIKQKVSSGSYGSPGELIREALCLQMFFPLGCDLGVEKPLVLQFPESSIPSAFEILPNTLQRGKKCLPLPAAI